MSLVVLYVATMVVFLVLDIIMLSLVMKPLFDRHVGSIMLDEPRLWVAGVFYLFYIAGVLWFASWPASTAEGGVWRAALNGALLGLVAYGTYEWVNMSTLKGWSWQMVFADTIWGGVITASSAAGGLVIAQALGYARG